MLKSTTVINKDTTAQLLLKKLNTPGLGKEMKAISYKRKKKVEKDKIGMTLFRSEIMLDTLTNKMILVDETYDINRYIFLGTSDDLKNKTGSWSDLAKELLESAIKRNLEILLSNEALSSHLNNYSFCGNTSNFLLSDFSDDIIKKEFFTITVNYFCKESQFLTDFLYRNRGFVLDFMNSISINTALEIIQDNGNIFPKDIIDDIMNQLVSEVDSIRLLNKIIKAYKDKAIMPSKNLLILKKNLSLSHMDLIDIAKRLNQRFELTINETEANSGFELLQIRTFFNREDISLNKEA